MWGNACGTRARGPLLVPTDVTVQVWLTENQLRSLEQSRSELLHRVARNVRHWAPLQHRIFTHLGVRMTKDNVAFLHDPLALACAFDESFCTIEELPIDLVDDGQLFRTLERPQPTETTHQLRVATTVDAPRFQRFLFDRLMQLA
jgi:inosine-uridine nucleoside N-ribohydrolase